MIGIVRRRGWHRIRSAPQLGAALAACRKQRGLTQAELAARTGVDRTTLLALEAGRPQSMERLVRFFSELGYDLAVVPRDAEVTVRLPTEPPAAQPATTTEA